MEVPRLGVQSEGATAAGLHHSHSNIRSKPHLPTYNRAHSNMGSLTHGARPGIEPITSWFLVRFISAEPQQELLICISARALREKAFSLDIGEGKFWGYDCILWPGSNVFQIGAGVWRDFRVCLGRKKKEGGKRLSSDNAFDHEN